MRELLVLLMCTASAMRTEHLRESPFQHQQMALDETGWQLVLSGAPRPMSALQDSDKLDTLPEAWAPRLTLQQKLGAGGFGSIYEARASCGSGGDVTVKVMHEKNHAKQYRELEMLRRMRGTEHVVSTAGKPDHVVTKEGMWIMMPYLDGGSLREHLDSCEKKAKETDPQWQNTHFTDPCSRYYLLAVFYQVLQGVQSMHQKSIVHMDIKPDNIMLHQKSALRVAQTYLVDLGLACFVGTCRFSGTPGFMPPELWDRKEPTAAFDMWALGVTLYNIVYRDSPPFYGDMDGKATRAFVPAEDTNIRRGSERRLIQSRKIRFTYHQTMLDMLVAQMLSRVEERITLPAAIDALRDILEKGAAGIPTAEDRAEALEMLKTPGAEPEVPPCLYDYRRDLGDGKMKEEFCRETSKEVKKGCGLSIKSMWRGRKCCECTALRHGSESTEHYWAVECV